MYNVHESPIGKSIRMCYTDLSVAFAHRVSDAVTNFRPISIGQSPRMTLSPALQCNVHRSTKRKVGMLYKISPRTRRRTGDPT